MNRTEHILASMMAGLLLALLWIVLVPERYEVKAKAQVSETPAALRAAGVIGDRVLTREVKVPFGNLLLVYSNGEARLVGALASGLGCETWQADVIGTDGYPAAYEFIVQSNGESDICIQGLGEKEQVAARVHSSASSLYLLRVNGEIVFAGTLAPLERSSGDVI